MTILFALWMYMLTQIVQYIYPAVMSSVVFSVVIGLGQGGTLIRLPYIRDIPNARMKVIAALGLIAYWGALLVFIVLHHFAERVHKWSYCLCLGINTVCSLLMLMWLPRLLQSPVLLGMMIVVYLVPITNAVICRDGRGVLCSTFYFVAFYFFCPTFMLCAAYAVCQTFNLSWGNRSATLHSQMLFTSVCISCLYCCQSHATLELHRIHPSWASTANQLALRSATCTDMSQTQI